MIDLFGAGVEPCSLGISSGFAGPGFEANAPRMEVSENILCLQFRFEYCASGPLVQEDSPTKPILDITQSFDVVFSSNRSSDRFTGKPYSSSSQLQYNLLRWYDPSTGRFVSRDAFPGFARNPQTQNGYSYAVDVPTVLTDPSGALAGQECGEEEWCGGLVQIPPDFFEPKGEVTGAGGGFTGEGTLPPAPEIISTEPTVNIQPVIDQSTQQSNQGLGYTQTDRINNLQNGIASHTSLMQDTLQQYSDEVANSSPGQERIIGESGHIRIPDLTNMGGLKSGNVIRYSGNLKDFIAYARGTGEPVRLYVRPWADISAIQEYIDAGYVEVYYVRPLSAVVV